MNLHVWLRGFGVWLHRCHRRHPWQRRLVWLAAAVTVAPHAWARIDKIEGPVAYETTAEMYSPGGLPDTAEGREIAAAGYVEEEYFLTGTGDVYATAQGGPVAEKSGLPFVTRMLVIRPKDAKRFNGIVHLTGIHPHLGGVQWNWISRLVLTSGAAYVAVGTGTDANSRSRSTPQWPVDSPGVIRWFNPARYGRMQWPEEDGIRWTIFSDVARVLRDKNRTVLTDLAIERVYASGWSFLGSFLRTYINEGFHDLLRQVDGRPLIDGYLIGISSPWQNGGYLPINSQMPVPGIGSSRRALRPIDAPVIEFLSQNEGYQNNAKQAPDRDEGLGRHRIYEVGGTSHGDLGVEVESSNQLQLRQRKHPSARPVPDCAYAPTDVPLRLLFSATMDNLDLWVSKGVAPPTSKRLEFTRAQEVARDAFGNPLGGVRSVQLDLPLARYGLPPARLCVDAVSPYILMHRMPFDHAELALLYPGGKNAYMARVAASIQQMVADRWLRAVDVELYTEQIDKMAAKAFPR